MIQNLFVQVLHLSEICSRQPPPTHTAITGASHVSHSTEKYRMERKTAHRERAFKNSSYICIDACENRLQQKESNNASDRQ